MTCSSNRAEYCRCSQPSCAESQQTIPREEQCSEWWQLKGNKPIIKTSKVAMGEASIPATLITPEQTSVTYWSSTRCKPGVFFYLQLLVLLLPKLYISFPPPTFSPSILQGCNFVESGHLTVCLQRLTLSAANITSSSICRGAFQAF